MGKDKIEVEKIIEIDHGKLKEELDELILGTGEDTLNSLLDPEAERLCRAKRYQHTEERVDTWAGYSRKYHTKPGP